MVQCVSGMEPAQGSLPAFGHGYLHIFTTVHATSRRILSSRTNVRDLGDYLDQRSLTFVRDDDVQRVPQKMCRYACLQGGRSSTSQRGNYPTHAALRRRVQKRAAKAALPVLPDRLLNARRPNKQPSPPDRFLIFPLVLRLRSVRFRAHNHSRPRSMPQPRTVPPATS